MSNTQKFVKIRHTLCKHDYVNLCNFVLYTKYSADFFKKSTYSKPIKTKRILPRPGLCILYIFKKSESNIKYLTAPYLHICFFMLKCL